MTRWILAFAALGLLAGCPAEDACMQWCQTTVSCNEDEGSQEWQDDVDACYAEFENQGLNDPVLGPNWEVTCQTNLDNWTGCGPG